MVKIKIKPKQQVNIIVFCFFTFFIIIRKLSKPMANGRL